MKKNIILGIIIVLLVVAVGVEGFFIWKLNEDQNTEVKEQTDEVEKTQPTEPSTKPNELPKDEIIDGEIKISKKYSNPDEDELVYTYLTVTVEDKFNYNPEYDESYYKYIYNIPQININSEDIEKINQEILKEYEDIINEMNDEQQINLGCEGLIYEYYENDGILSLVMINKTESGGVFNCKTYNIEISTGKVIDNIELLKKMNIEESDVKETIIRDIRFKMYDIYNEPSVYGASSFIEEQKNKTLDKYENISIDEIELYLNDDANICAYLVIYAIVGGDYLTEIWNLETSEFVESI